MIQHWALRINGPQNLWNSNTKNYFNESYFFNSIMNFKNAISTINWLYQKYPIDLIGESVMSNKYGTLNKNILMQLSQRIAFPKSLVNVLFSLRKTLKIWNCSPTASLAYWCLDPYSAKNTIFIFTDDTQADRMLPIKKGLKRKHPKNR